jgi:GR25 family glycosyltransferase involved in LPS biosynthesis
MANINTYFDMIYVINLKRRPDRLEKVLKQFTIHNITNYTIFEATDGALHPYYHSYLQKGFTDSPGAFGILVSAMRLILNATKNKYKRILILEDDVVFHNDFQNQFSKRIPKIPQDWKMLYLGSSLHKWRIKERCKINKENEYMTATGTIVGAFALGLDSSIFPDLLYDLNSTTKQWDLGPLRLINQLYNNKCIILHPYLVLCDTRDSDIRRSKTLKEKQSTAGWDLTQYKF